MANREHQGVPKYKAHLASKPTKRVAKLATNDNGRGQRPKVMRILEDCLVREQQYQRRIRAAFIEDCAAGRATARNADGSWYTTPPTATTATTATTTQTTED